MATLYRKYRPQSFKELVGQNHIKITLQHEIATGKTAQAYLFCGPRGVGKTTIARIIAKALSCENRKSPDFEPCNACRSCVDITAGNSLDMVEIDAASHTGVDNVRENIIAVSRIAPSRSSHKVFIIDEAHMLSISAFNALLKVMEEPPENVLFVLCTTEVHKIPDTIISRCERFDFKRMNVSDLVSRLAFIAEEEKIKISEEILVSIARHSEGYMRDAVSLLGQVVAIGGQEITKEEADLVIPRSDLGEVISLIEATGKKDAAKAIVIVNRLIDDGVDLKKFAFDLVELLRKLMLIKVNPALSVKMGLDMGADVEARLSELGSGLSLVQIVQFIEKFLDARGKLGSSFIKQLPLEMAIISLCVGSAQSPEAGISVPRPAMKFAGAFAKDAQSGAPAAEAAQTIVKSSISQLSKEDLVSKWHEVLAKIKSHNHSLSFILRVCEPRSIDGNQVCLAFKYKFHKDRLGDSNIKQIVEKVLHEVYGHQLLVEAIVDETLASGEGPQTAQPDMSMADMPDNPDAPFPDENPAQSDGKIADDQIVDSLLKTFGGKVVN